jgi:hypothetical protein
VLVRLKPYSTARGESWMIRDAHAPATKSVRDLLLQLRRATEIATTQREVGCRIMPGEMGIGFRHLGRDYQPATVGGESRVRVA